jgi:hypothetical protein
VAPVVVRAGDRRHLRFGSEGVDIFVLVQGVENDALNAELTTYEADSEVEESRPFDGVVLVSVLEASSSWSSPMRLP